MDLLSPALKALKAPNVLINEEFIDFTEGNDLTVKRTGCSFNVVELEAVYEKELFSGDTAVYKLV